MKAREAKAAAKGDVEGPPKSEIYDGATKAHDRAEKRRSVGHQPKATRRSHHQKGPGPRLQGG